jgi:hypothetical protein
MWGKLIGGAIFPWYCALICLAVMIWYGLQAVPAELRLPLWLQVATLLVGAVLGQATSLTVGLLLLRKTQFRRRLTVTMAQIAGLLAFGLAIGWDYSANPWAASVDQITWYDRAYDGWLFYLVSAAAFALWALLAVFRLMCLELLYTTRPWAWTLFVLFVMAYAAGFVGWEIQALPSRLAIAYTTASFLTYAAFFAETKDPVRYRWGLARFGAMQWWRALEFMPWWLILQRDASWFTLAPIAFNIVALLLFLLRDMFFLLWLNFGRTRSRADLTGLVILVVAYVPLPMLLTAAGLLQFLPAVTPFTVTNALSVAWPAVETVAMAVLLYLRWRVAARIEIVPGNDEPTI